MPEYSTIKNKNRYFRQYYQCKIIISKDMLATLYFKIPVLPANNAAKPE